MVEMTVDYGRSPRIAGPAGAAHHKEQPFCYSTRGVRSEVMCAWLLGYLRILPFKWISQHHSCRVGITSGVGRRGIDSQFNCVDYCWI